MILVDDFLNFLLQPCQHTFRGRDKKGVWHKGDLITNALNSETNLFLMNRNDVCIKAKIRASNGKEFEVDYNSVGEFVGAYAFLDKKSDKEVELFTGDVVESKYILTTKYPRRFLVAWDNHSKEFIFYCLNPENELIDKAPIYASNGGDNFLLGNVYDNPELLEEGAHYD